MVKAVNITYLANHNEYALFTDQPRFPRPSTWWSIIIYLPFYSPYYLR